MIGDIICLWFGSVEAFDTMVREQVLEVFEEKLGRCMIPYATGRWFKEPLKLKLFRFFLVISPTSERLGLGFFATVIGVFD